MQVSHLSTGFFKVTEFVTVCCGSIHDKQLDIQCIETYLQTDLSHAITDVKTEITKATATFVSIKPIQGPAPILFNPQFPFVQRESKDFNVPKLKALADIKLTGDLLCHIKKIYNLICGAFNAFLYIHLASQLI